MSLESSIIDKTEDFCQKTITQKYICIYEKWLWLFLLFVYTGFSAQIKDVVKWTYQLNKISDSEYEAVLTAKMESGWHIYSKDLPPDSGIPTEMKVTSKDIQTIGGFREAGKKLKSLARLSEPRLYTIPILLNSFRSSN